MSSLRTQPFDLPTYPKADIETTNSHNYLLEAGAVLNIHTASNDERIKVLQIILVGGFGTK